MNRYVSLRVLISVLFALVSFASLPFSGTATAQDTPSFELVSPLDGATIDTTDILVQVNVSNFDVNCAQSGMPDKDGTGQVLALIDGTTVAQLTNIYCTTSFVVPTNGLTAGEHQLAVVLASNTHVPMMDTAKVVTFNYQPAQPLPLPVANYTGDVGVTLVSPQDGETVGPVFDVQVQPQNFSPATELEGKTNVPGYGHYHVWVDTAEMPTSLAGLVLMPGTNAFTLDLTDWGLGEHQIRIEPAQNDHTMYDPSNSVTFTVNVVETAATPTTGTSMVATPATGGYEVSTPAAGNNVVATPPVASDMVATPAASPEALTIEMTDALRFSPDTLTISVGQTVTWVNASAMPHSATADASLNPVADQFPDYASVPDGAEAWDSGILQPGESFSYTFTVAGDYNYFCIPHVLSGMHASISVEG